MPHFMIVLITYISLLNLSWIIKCLFFEEYGALNIKSVKYNGEHKNAICTKCTDDFNIRF